jgi:hypothetical protein
MEPSTARLFVWDRGVVVIRINFRIAHSHKSPTKSGGSPAGRGCADRHGPDRMIWDDVREPDDDGVEPDDQGKMFIISPRQRCVRSMHAPSVIGLRVWLQSLQATAAYTFGGSCCSAFQSVDRRAVRVPESFRGGCSFGGRHCRLSPARRFQLIRCRTFEADLRNAACVTATWHGHRDARRRNRRRSGESDVRSA